MASPNISLASEIRDAGRKINAIQLMDGIGSHPQQDGPNPANPKNPETPASDIYPFKCSAKNSSVRGHDRSAASFW